MINQRMALYKHLQRFFEREIYEFFRWGQVEHFDAEPSSPPKGRARHPFGRERETVTIRFGEYLMRLESPHEAPPLGKIRFEATGDVIEGPLSPDTWKEIGAFIRKQQEVGENV